MFTHIKIIALSGCLLLLTLLTACKEKPPQASAGAQRYEVKGKVVSADKANLKVTIDHEAIPNYMDAMAMPFTLPDEWVYDDLTPGALIQATLVVDTGRSWLENPIVTKIVDASLARSEESGIEPKVGAETPDFTLVNQDGRRINFRLYRGQTLLLTFIYTRCPLPDYCPLMTQNFKQIYAALPKDAKTHLLSISVDPDYDTPKVLRAYGAKFGGDFKRWEFAAGSTDEVKQVAQFFGLNYWSEKDQIIHGLRTAIIAPDGKVVKVYRGNDWQPEQVLQELQAAPAGQIGTKP